MMRNIIITLCAFVFSVQAHAAVLQSKLISDNTETEIAFVSSIPSYQWNKQLVMKYEEFQSVMKDVYAYGDNIIGIGRIAYFRVALYADVYHVYAWCNSNENTDYQYIQLFFIFKD